ncbi:hypothetical protein AXF42_Ash004708 [Apostasia shenzhenica]|uniref:BZIP domain-containing protein n=1 Tax=Apostasia shenzhenica TaxID=1088818 RepID=A0A2I0BHE1_9ASPA|nr:hypothetical protein AXF42_Ash004708 [Apostasia shenzhenica]
MAELAAAGPISPFIHPSDNPEFLDPHPIPDDLSCDLDLDLEGINWDFSVDDFLISEDPCQSPPSRPPSCDESRKPDSGLSLSCPVTGDLSENNNRRSPESGHSANCSAESFGDEKREEKSRWGTKRRKDREEGSANSNLNTRVSKFRRSEEVDSCVFNTVGEEEDKRKARLMRNRESAQLSRQRKKHYVEELEDKVRSMHTTIADLNSKISFFMAENANLRRQLGGNGGSGSQPGIYASPPMASMHFPWIPYPMTTFRPQGSPIPLIPIPKLKPQQPAKASKARKSESKKGESNTRKVASVSLLGLFSMLLIYCVLVPGGYTSKERVLHNSHGRVLSVIGPTNRLNYTSEFRFNDPRGIRDPGFNGIAKTRLHKEYLRSEEKSGASDTQLLSHNSSETLPAFLYVPRNGKHVKINGNLIINSVLASEKAVAQTKTGNPDKDSSREEDAETGLGIAGNLASALALSESGLDAGRNSKSYGSSTEKQRALASDSENGPRDTLQDGPLQQWFREGMAGPIFSSGTCTEVFQFEISPGIIPAPAPSSSNATSNLTQSPSNSTKKNKNRRFLYPQAIPLTGSALDNDTKHLGKAPESGSGFAFNNSSASHMVVSILADPREAGDGDADGMMSKSLSRIFVVVLLDSVKYVTYSCVLPLKSSGPHLVS